ncbi:MAG: ribose 5-phosphate isomerase B [Alphaproteobacteria bacterium]
MSYNIIIGSDHAGYKLKTLIKEFLDKNYYILNDVGTDSEESVDYPDICNQAINAIQQDTEAKAILICGTGIGMSIAANRHKFIRAALCYNKEAAVLARKHNDANILVLGSRMINSNDAIDSVKAFLNTEFEAGRHLNRINKIDVGNI